MIGVVVRDERVLAIRRADNGHWETPAGILEHDETFEACVEREVREETGVEVRASRLTGVYKNMAHPKRPVTMVWLCDYMSGQPRHTEEAVDVRWLDLDEIRALMAPAYATRVFDALENDHPGPDAVSIRYHNGSNIVYSNGG